MRAQAAARPSAAEGSGRRHSRNPTTACRVVGRRATYKVVVRNQGTVSARNVEVVAFAPPELKVVRAAGAKDGRTDAAGKITFPVIEDLRPGEAATFMIEADAAQAGDARFRVEVRSAHLRTPLKEEQSTRVTGGR